jgi:signal transduction histidine kinase
MRRLHALLWPAGVAIGLAAEATQYRWDDPGQWVPDLLVGWVFVACGLVAWARRPESRSGALMVATGFAWFLPNFASAGNGFASDAVSNTLFWHRGPLVQLLLTYPTGRTSSHLTRSAIVVAYASAIVYPVWHNEIATILLAVSLVVIVAWRYRRSTGPLRRARLLVLWATAASVVVLAGEALVRLSTPANFNEPMLIVYEATLSSIALVLTIGLLTTSWERASVTDLVVQLSEARSRTLRDELARALGDPSLDVGYWLAQERRFVDARGQAILLPAPASDRSFTEIERDGQPIAVLVHDPAVSADPGLMEAVSSAAKLGAANAQLQAGVRARQAEIRESRQRIVLAADGERIRLERRIHQGPERRLQELEETLDSARRSADGQTGERIDQARSQLAKTQDDVRRLARGIHPRELTERGLAGALDSLVEVLTVPADLAVHGGPFPADVEACAYFVCSESLANVAKYARASTVIVRVSRDGDSVTVTVEDDGVGGADPATGSGLRGLADRVETLGGSLLIESRHATGTRVSAVIPVGNSP